MSAAAVNVNESIKKDSKTDTETSVPTAGDAKTTTTTTVSAGSSGGVKPSCLKANVFRIEKDARLFLPSATVVVPMHLEQVVWLEAVGDAYDQWNRTSKEERMKGLSFVSALGVTVLFDQLRLILKSGDQLICDSHEPESGQQTLRELGITKESSISLDVGFQWVQPKTMFTTFDLFETNKEEVGQTEKHS